MHAHDRAIDHLNFAVMGLGNSCHQPVPDASLAPAIKAIVGGRVGSIPFGQITPRRSRSQHPKDTIHDPSIILRLLATPPLRQHWLDDTPLEIRQVVAHDQASFEDLNHSQLICATIN